MRVYLREWREHFNLTLEQVGGRIEPPVAKGTVSRWEEAPPGGLTLGVIAAYAEALDRHVTEMYLLPPAEDRPSLDVMAESLDEQARGRIVGYIEALKGRKAL